jgi:hypothetical protein
MIWENPTEFLHMTRLTDPGSPYQPPQLHECVRCGHLYQLAPAPAGIRHIRNHTTPDTLSTDLCFGSLKPPVRQSSLGSRATHWVPQGQIRTKCCLRLPAEIPAWHRFSPVSASSTCTGRTTPEGVSAQ